LLVSRERLREKITADPDMPCEAGSGVSLPDSGDAPPAEPPAALVQLRADAVRRGDSRALLLLDALGAAWPVPDGQHRCPTCGSWSDDAAVGRAMEQWKRLHALADAPDGLRASLEETLRELVSAEWEGTTADSTVICSWCKRERPWDTPEQDEELSHDADCVWLNVTRRARAALGSAPRGGEP